MKAMMMSIRPRHVCNILNGIKKREVRSKFPKDFVGWVYIYCTKDSKKGWCMVGINGNETYYQKYDKYAAYSPKHNYMGNGKVVARFWCDKVEEITTRQDRFKEFVFYETSLDMENLLMQSCLDYNELDNYLHGKNGYAIHIIKLEIFDKPKELYDFKVSRPFTYTNGLKSFLYYPLTKAPESYCYMEVENE